MDFCWQSNVSAFYYAVSVCYRFSSKGQVSFNFVASCCSLRGPLNCPYFFKFVFLFAVLTGWFLLFSLSDHLCVLPYPLLYPLLLCPSAAAKSLQSCPTLCDRIDGSPPGSPVPGILQARTLEWVAISFSNAWKWKVKVKLLSRVRLFETPWTAAQQAPPSMGFSRQEYWSGVPLPSPYVLLVCF